MVKPHLAAAALFFAAPAFAQSTPPAPPPYACTAPEHRAFDFWLGEWDAYVTGTENLAGRSTIASADRGCVVTEQWTSVRSPYSGRSLNAYDPTTRTWVQVWMDSNGEITRYAGAATANGMVLTAPDEVSPGRPAKVHLRMTFTANPDGSVRQFGEQSADAGQTWAPSFDFIYRKRPPAR